MKTDLTVDPRQRTAGEGRLSDPRVVMGAESRPQDESDGLDHRLLVDLLV